MDYAAQITELGGSAKHAAFAAFIEMNLHGRAMPAYKSLDLMEIPRLVPQIWVIDARRGIDDGLMILFSGTDIDLHFGRVLMGSCLTDNYAENYSREVFAAYRQVITDRRALYTERSDYYPGVEPEVERRIKVVLFPCAEDGSNVDFAIGLTTFENTEETELSAPLITWLDPPG